MSLQRIAIIIGTRPEAIKMAPVIQALKKRSNEIEVVVIVTGQHRQMLDQVLTLFQISPDVDLDLMRQNQTLVDLTSGVLTTIAGVLEEVRPNILLVQGDTTTVFAASVAAFYLKIPVGHVEAGLRSHDAYNPFPEEINRRLTTVLADIHFAPTAGSRAELLHEGVPEKKIVVTGNTVVDALSTILANPFDFENTPLAGIPFDGHRILLVTSHRRESWGHELENICLALRDLVERFKDLLVVYPVHMNPNVRKTVMTILAGVDRIYLTEPLDYLTFLNLMRRSHLILTDSGGVQEEAPTLGKPLLVLRKLTERPEAFQAGMSKVVGTSHDSIIREASRLLDDQVAYNAMASGHNPFGDGHAAERIAEVLCRRFREQYPLLEAEQEFRPALNALYRSRIGFLGV